MIIQRRDKKNVKTLSYTIFEGNGLTAKFKIKMSNQVKTGNKTTDVDTVREYILGSGTTISIAANPFIEIVLKNSGASEYFIVNEVYRARMIRRLQKVTNAIELFDSQELDILQVTGPETRLHSELVPPITIAIGNQNVTFRPSYSAEFSSVLINIEYNSVSISLRTWQYLSLIQKLREIDFNNMTIGLLNYYNTYNENEISQVSFNDKFTAPRQDIEYGPINTLTPMNDTLESLGEPEKPKRTGITW